MLRSVGDIWQRAVKEMGTLGCRVMAGLRSKLKKQEASSQSEVGGIPSSMHQAGQENVWSASLTEQKQSSVDACLKRAKETLFSKDLAGAEVIQEAQVLKKEPQLFITVRWCSFRNPACRYIFCTCLIQVFMFFVHDLCFLPIGRRRVPEFDQTVPDLHRRCQGP